MHAEPGHLESRPSHDLASEAEPLPEWPLAVHGTIGRPAEVDYYAFSVSEGERLRFEVRSLALSDMAISLYEPAGSWFSPHRARRLAFSDEPVAYPERSTEPVLRYRFGKSGRYLVRGQRLSGRGRPGSSLPSADCQGCGKRQGRGIGFGLRRLGLGNPGGNEAGLGSLGPIAWRRCGRERRCRRPPP